jgi:hypothetical protein
MKSDCLDPHHSSRLLGRLIITPRWASKSPEDKLVALIQDFERRQPFVEIILEIPPGNKPLQPDNVPAH